MKRILDFEVKDCYCVIVLFFIWRERVVFSTSSHLSELPWCLSELPWCLSGKEFPCQYRRCEFNPWVGKIPWKRKWQPTPVFLRGKSHGQRSLLGYSLWGPKRVRHDWVNEQQQHSRLSCLFHIAAVRFIAEVDENMWSWFRRPVKIKSTPG